MSKASTMRNKVIDKQINNLIPRIAAASDTESVRIRSRIRELEALRKK